MKTKEKKKLKNPSIKERISIFIQYNESRTCLNKKKSFKATSRKKTWFSSLFFEKRHAVLFFYFFQ